MKKINPYAKQVCQLIKAIGLKPVVSAWNEIYCYSQYEYEKVWITIVPSAHEDKVKLSVQCLYSDRPDYAKIVQLDGLVLTH